MFCKHPKQNQNITATNEFNLLIHTHTNHCFFIRIA